MMIQDCGCIRSSQVRHWDFSHMLLPVALPDSLVAVHSGGGFLRVLAPRQIMLLDKVSERELRRREVLTAVHGFHQTIQKVSNVSFRAVDVALVCQFDSLSFSPSV